MTENRTGNPIYVSIYIGTSWYSPLCSRVRLFVLISFKPQYGALFPLKIVNTDFLSLLRQDGGHVRVSISVRHDAGVDDRDRVHVSLADLIPAATSPITDSRSVPLFPGTDAWS